jgi:hypothetical protein
MRVLGGLRLPAIPYYTSATAIPEELGKKQGRNFLRPCRDF